MSEIKITYRIEDKGESLVVDAMKADADEWLKKHTEKSVAEKKLKTLTEKFRDLAVSTYGIMVRASGARAGGVKRVIFESVSDKKGRVMVSLPDIEKEGNLKALDQVTVTAVREAGLNGDLLVRRVEGGSQCRLVVEGPLAEKVYARMSQEDKNTVGVTFAESQPGEHRYYLAPEGRAKLYTLASEGNAVAAQVLENGMRSCTVRKGA